MQKLSALHKGGKQNNNLYRQEKLTYLPIPITDGFSQRSPSKVIFHFHWGFVGQQ